MKKPALCGLLLLQPMGEMIGEQFSRSRVPIACHVSGTVAFSRRGSMMRVLMAVMVAALLAGCAGSVMNEARSKSPYKVLSSAKAEQVVAQCVQFAWQDEAVFGVDASAYLESAKVGGYTVYTRSAESFADIRGQASGTTVNYYATQDNWVAKRRLAALATCL